MNLSQADIAAIADELFKRLDKRDHPPRWLLFSEAMVYARASKNTLVAMIKDGRIRATKRGGNWIVDKNSIDEYYEAGSGNDEALFQDFAKRAGL